MAIEPLEKVVRIIPPVVTAGVVIRTFPVLEEVSRLAEEKYKRKIVSIQEVV